MKLKGNAKMMMDI